MEGNGRSGVAVSVFSGLRLPGILFARSLDCFDKQIGRT